MRSFRRPLSALLSFSLCVGLVSPAAATSFVRSNQAGYLPDSEKKIVVLSDEDITGQPFRVLRAGVEEQSGVVPSSVIGVGPHTPKPHQYVLDLSALTEVGLYELEVPGSAPVSIRVDENPYGFLINQILRHLRVARSGTDTAALHPASHLGDAQALLYRPLGDPAQGAWEPDPSGATVDMLGGWYDAGDYIKFTLTCAYTTYFLLRAYEVNPALFTKSASATELVDLLDEAGFGLDYLAKTLPSADRFIIQVSTGADHDVGSRLPEDDTRDGSREALSALSVPHMGLTAAALALGARVFREAGFEERAAAYEERAKAIYARLREPDALTGGAFERDDVNDFYRDQSSADNVALAAIELYELTGEDAYLETAVNERPPAGYWVSWGSLNVFANQRTGRYDDATRAVAQDELAHFVQNGSDNFWNLPLSYSWASLTNWLGVAAAAGVDAGSTTPTSGAGVLFWDLLDYTLGKNNWGLAFIASPDLPRTADRIYSQIYTLTGEFPLGAVSEGPGDRATHDSLLPYFGSLDTSLEEFDTSAAVFYNDEKDFMTQESVIVGQANAVFVLALASRAAEGPGVPPGNPNEPEPPTNPGGPGGGGGDSGSAEDGGDSSDAGCGCSAAGRSGAGLGWLALGGLFAALASRRRGGLALSGEARTLEP